MPTSDVKGLENEFNRISTLFKGCSRFKIARETRKYSRPTI
jgi:hypothetical protein